MVINEQPTAPDDPTSPKVADGAASDTSFTDNDYDFDESWETIDAIPDPEGDALNDDKSVEHQVPPIIATVPASSPELTTQTESTFRQDVQSARLQFDSEVQAEDQPRDMADDKERRNYVKSFMYVDEPTEDSTSLVVDKCVLDEVGDVVKCGMNSPDEDVTGGGVPSQAAFNTSWRADPVDSQSNADPRDCADGLDEPESLGTTPATQCEAVGAARANPSDKKQEQLTHGAMAAPLHSDNGRASENIIKTTSPISTNGVHGPFAQNENAMLSQQQNHMAIQAEAMRMQAALNNAVTSYVNSLFHREDAELKALERQGIDSLWHQLASRPIENLQKSFEVKAAPPLDFLPTKMFDFIIANSNAIDLPAASHPMLMVGLIGAAFIAARGKFKIKVSDDHSELLTGYVVAAAESGDGKSAIIDLLRRPFDEEQSELQQKFFLDKRATKQEALRSVVKAMKVKINKNILEQIEAGADTQTALSSIEAELNKIDDIEESIGKQSVLPHLLTESPTMERLPFEMAQQEGVLGIFESEAAIWKQRVRGNSDVIMLKGYTGESFSTATKGDGPVRLPYPCLAILTFCQPAAMEYIYDKTEIVKDGFVPRILPFAAPTVAEKGSSVRGGSTEEALAWYRKKIKSLLRIALPLSTEAVDSGGAEAVPEVERDADGPAGNTMTGANSKITSRCGPHNKSIAVKQFHILNLTGEANHEFTKYVSKLKSQASDGAFDKFRAFGKKLGGHAIRLAGAVHLLKCDEPQKHPIDGQTMRAGIELAQFFRQHAAAAFDRDARDGIVCANEILDWIRHNRLTTFTEREAHRAIGSNRDRHTSAQVKIGIDILERTNHLHRFISGRGKSVVCVVHPRAIN